MGIGIDIHTLLSITWGFPGGTDKEYVCQAGDSDMILGLGRFSGVGKWQPILVSLPGKFQDRGA